MQDNTRTIHAVLTRIFYRLSKLKYGLVVFYGISTLVGYLMLDSVSTCMICK